MNTISSFTNRCSTAICSVLPSPVVKAKDGSSIESYYKLRASIGAAASISFILLGIQDLYSTKNVLESFQRHRNNASFCHLISDDPFCTFTPINFMRATPTSLTFLAAASSFALYAIYNVIQMQRASSAINESIITEKNSLIAEKLRADNAIITEFVTNPFPSEKCFEKIAKSSHLLKAVIERDKTSLNKKNPEGKTLLRMQNSWSPDNSTAIIELLLKNGQWDSKEIYELLNYHMIHDHKKFNPLCTTTLIKLLTPDHQRELLLYSPSIEALRALKTAGVDINVAGKDGLTPLQKICKQHLYTSLSKAFLAHALLEAGADISAKVRVSELEFEFTYTFGHKPDDMEEKDVLQLAREFSKDPDLIAVLEKHISSQESNQNTATTMDEPDLS